MPQEITTEQELADILESLSENATFQRDKTSEKLTRIEFQEISENDKLKGIFNIPFFNVVVKDSEMERILPTLRNLLDKFIDDETDKIGDGLAKIAEGVLKPIPLTDYVKILIRAAAILGEVQTAELLLSWINGKPIRYKQIYILEGISVDKKLIFQEGLEINQLPDSINEVARKFPAMSLDYLSLINVKRGVALSIECEYKPALYQPLKGIESINKLKSTKNSEFIFSIERICEAMSLTSNGCVRWRYNCCEFGDVKYFLNGLGPIISGALPYTIDSTKFTQETIDQARENYKILIEKIDSKPGLNNAVKRWIKSKESKYSITDSLIELRIALESLYLNKNNSELRFRLASYGAWHLGQCFEQRKEIFKTLSETYKFASNAVHGGNIPSDDSRKELLEKAQDICRKGILKRLSDDEEPKWDDLILGVKSKLHK